MEYIFIFFGIIILFALFSKKDTNQKTIEVEMPNPDKCQDQTITNPHQKPAQQLVFFMSHITPPKTANFTKIK